MKRPVDHSARLKRVTIALTLIALGALLVPMRQNPDLRLLFNLAHIPGFMLLAMVWAECLFARGWPRRNRLIAVGGIGLVVAIATEGLQMLSPGRYADLGDILRNALGIGIGLAAHTRWPFVFSNRLN